MFATRVQLVWFPIIRHLDILRLGTKNPFSTSKIFYKSNSTVKPTHNREGNITKGKKKGEKDIFFLASCKILFVGQQCYNQDLVGKKGQYKMVLFDCLAVQGMVCIRKATLTADYNF